MLNWFSPDDELTPVLVIRRETGGISSDHMVCNYETSMNEYLMSGVGTFVSEYIPQNGEWATLNRFIYYNPRVE